MQSHNKFEDVFTYYRHVQNQSCASEESSLQIRLASSSCFMLFNWYKQIYNWFNSEQISSSFMLLE